MQLPSIHPGNSYCVPFAAAADTAGGGPYASVAAPNWRPARRPTAIGAVWPRPLQARGRPYAHHTHRLLQRLPLLLLTRGAWHHGETCCGGTQTLRLAAPLQTHAWGSTRRPAAAAAMLHAAAAAAARPSGLPSAAGNPPPHPHTPRRRLLVTPVTWLASGGWVHALLTTCRPPTCCRCCCTQQLVAPGGAAGSRSRVCCQRC